VTQSEKTSFLLNHAVTSINGNNVVSSVTAKDRETGEEKRLKVSGVFIYIGFLANSKFLQGTVELSGSGYIVSNEKMETSMPGIYAAGDVRSKEVRQIDVACAEGTVAAISASRYIKETA